VTAIRDKRGSVTHVKVLYVDDILTIPAPYLNPGQT
jgi:hypothetical protein